MTASEDLLGLLCPCPQLQLVRKQHYKCIHRTLCTVIAISVWSALRSTYTSIFTNWWWGGCSWAWLRLFIMWHGCSWAWLRYFNFELVCAQFVPLHFACRDGCWGCCSVHGGLAPLVTTLDLFKFTKSA